MEFNIVKLQIEDREIFGCIQTHPTKTPKAKMFLGPERAQKVVQKNCVH